MVNTCMIERCVIVLREFFALYLGLENAYLVILSKESFPFSPDGKHHILIKSKLGPMSFSFLNSQMVLTSDYMRYWSHIAK